MDVVVTGGAGFLGRRIYHWLESNGHKPHPMAMKNEDTTGLTNVFKGDITDKGSFDLPKCDAVIHCAGILESSHPTDELMMKVNLEGTKIVFNKAIVSGAKTFIFISTISALGPHGSKEKPMDEGFDPKPADIYGRSKLEAEIFLENSFKDKSIKVIIIRPSVLYGPGMNLNSSGMKTFTAINKRIMPLVGDGSTTLNMLYVDNLVEAIGICLLSDVDLRTYHVAERPYSQMEVISAIENRIGRKGHKRYPLPLLFIMTFFSELLSPLMRGPPPLSWTKYHGLTKDHWTMSSHRIRDELDYREPVSLEEGINRTCTHYDW